jgi:HAD superfamily hydrolase (TIGR01509 family)
MILQSIIFDFDGVLIDTELTTFKFYQELLKKYNITLSDEDFKYKIGKKSIDFFTSILRDKFDPELIEELTRKKRDAFQKDIKKYLKPIDGVFPFLEHCSTLGIPLAIGSQNKRILLEKAVDVFEIRKYFKTIVSLQDIENKKPDPEIFLLVANRLNVEPQYTIVTEDAPIGIGAANKGGFISVGITSSHSRNELKGAKYIVDHLNEIKQIISTMSW